MCCNFNMSDQQGGITNVHRLLYLLDCLAEPFPQEVIARNGQTCKCGAEGVDGAVDTNGAAETNVVDHTDVSNNGVPVIACKRDLIEKALLESLGQYGLNLSTTNQSNNNNTNTTNNTNSEQSKLVSRLSQLSDGELFPLLQGIDVPRIDNHLNDLALFMNPERPGNIKTSIDEIVKWDKRHANDFKLANLPTTTTTK